MTPPRWAFVFILGVCAGYGAAHLIPPGATPQAGPRPERAAPAQPTHHPAPSPRDSAPRRTTPPEPPPAPSATRLEAAYHALINKSAARGDFATALDLLADARQRLGIHPGRLRLRAEIHRLRKDFQAARATLHQLISFDPAAAETAYPLLRQVVLALIDRPDETLGIAEKIQILSEEIIDDPGFAAYYARLGRLQYGRGNYPDAITHLEYALQLDPGRAAALSPLLATARRRLTQPEWVEIPLSPRGRALDVTVRLNGAPRRFHFILDTGASHTAISQDTARRLGIVLSGGLPVTRISTANGMIEAPVVLLEKIDLQGAVVEQTPAVVLRDLNGADGLLGLSFLNHFNIDIKQDEGKLLLFRNH